MRTAYFSSVCRDDGRLKLCAIHSIDYLLFFLFFSSSSKLRDVVLPVQTKAHITVRRSKVVWQLCQRKWSPLTKREHPRGHGVSKTTLARWKYKLIIRTNRPEHLRRFARINTNVFSFLFFSFFLL